MPPRYAYWTILAGGLPTAFRAADREDLLPTLKRLAATHPDAELKWFARGRLWSSPEEAREAPRARTTDRGRDWRPGGEHRDPRQEFKDAKKARNADRRQQRFNRKQGQGTAVKPDHAGQRPGPRRHAPGDPSTGPAGTGRKPPSGRPSGGRPPGSRPPGSRPPGNRPPGNRPPGSRPPGNRPPGSRPSGGRAPGNRPKGGGRR